MNRYYLSCWTGPTCVQEIAIMMREAGIKVACEGTEYVHAIVEGNEGGAAAWNLLAALSSTHGTDAGLRPTIVRRVNP